MTRRAITENWATPASSPNSPTSSTIPRQSSLHVLCLFGVQFWQTPKIYFFCIVVNCYYVSSIILCNFIILQQPRFWNCGNVVTQFWLGNGTCRTPRVTKNPDQNSKLRSKLFESILSRGNENLICLLILELGDTWLPVPLSFLWY